MSDDSVSSEHERLLARLRGLARDVDPVPDEVTEYARTALGWRRVDAELAELLADSALERTPAGVRGLSVRTLMFKAGELTVHVEVHERDAGRILLGQIDPAVSAPVEAQRDDGTVAASSESDSHGRFRLELRQGGRIRLLIRRAPPAVPLETSWIDA